MEAKLVRILQGCNSLRRLYKIQGFVIVNGLHEHPSISNLLINFCAVSVSGSLNYARFLFDRLHNPQTQAWNSIIRGYAQSLFPLHALSFYNRMRCFSSPPDNFTFSFALKACERMKLLTKCQELHAYILRLGYYSDVVVCTSLLRCYSASDLVQTAAKLFDEMPHRDLVSWNAMISCYSQTGLHHSALNMFHKMPTLDAFTLVALLSSCAHVGEFNMGVHLHSIASEKGFVAKNVFVGNALIDMYAKCGSLDKALSVFNAMPKKDVLTWNSMIVGYGVHGDGDKAVSFFRRMLMEGMQPNSITFLGLLCGCSHQGLVKEGIEHFEMMSSRFNLRPGIKHHGCMVDLFGRSGKLDKALEIIHTSRSQDDPVLWRTLLSSCKIHRNAVVGEIAMTNLIRLGASSAGDYMLLATIYGMVKDARGVARMRKLIKGQGIHPTPGWSCIEIGDQVQRFVVGDETDSTCLEVYQKPEEVNWSTKLAE